MIRPAELRLLRASTNLSMAAVSAAFLSRPEGFLHTVLSDLSNEILKDCGTGVDIEVNIVLNEVERLG